VVADLQQRDRRGDREVGLLERLGVNKTDDLQWSMRSAIEQTFALPSHSSYQWDGISAVSFTSSPVSTGTVALPGSITVTGT
jgi:hypothetical protein